MATTTFSPEWTILDRTHKTLVNMAASGEFVRSTNEAVRSVGVKQVFKWRTLEGSDHNQQSGIVNMPFPCILVSIVPVKSSSSNNCSDDELVTVAVQIVDDATGPAISQGPLRSYMDWMNRIRKAIIGNLTLFRQDFTPATADPYITVAKDRVPSDPQKLWSHEQQVAAFSFYVKVRHRRTA